MSDTYNLLVSGSYRVKVASASDETGDYFIAEIAPARVGMDYVVQGDSPEEALAALRAEVECDGLEILSLQKAGPA